MLQNNTEYTNGDNSWNFKIDSYGVADIGHHETNEYGTGLKVNDFEKKIFF